jgi:hypothetical protein
MTTCEVCNDEIKHGESHLGPPFVENIRHMRCPPKCKKCGIKFATEIGLHEHECGRTL